MALPDYNRDSTASFGNPQQARRQRRRDRRQDRRADRRAANAAGLYSQTDPQAEYDQQDTYGTDDAMSVYTDNQGQGFQGNYISPDNSYEHPFYTPGASYARPGENFYNINGTDLQKNYIEQNPAAGYYGWAANGGYGGLDAKSQAVQGMYKDFATGYEAAKAYNNFEGNFQSFLNQQNVPQLLEQMTSDQIGIDRSRFNARDRWSQRGA